MRTVCEQSVSRQRPREAIAHHRARDLGHARLAADAMDPHTRRLPAPAQLLNHTPRPRPPAPGAAVLDGFIGHLPGHWRAAGTARCSGTAVRGALFTITVGRTPWDARITWHGAKKRVTRNA